MPTVNDSTGVAAAIKHFGVAATSTDPALVVTMSPNSAGGGGGSTTANQGTATATAGAWPTKLVDSAGTNVAAVSAAGAVKVDGSAVTQPVSGAVTISSGTVTANQGTANATAAWSFSDGGSTTASVAAGTVVNTVIKNSAGRLCRVLVTTVGTGAVAVNIYDNATTTSGTIIGSFPITAPVGSVYDFSIPAANGITVGGSATAPGMTISFY